MDSLRLDVVELENVAVRDKPTLVGMREGEGLRMEIELGVLN